MTAPTITVPQAQEQFAPDSPLWHFQPVCMCGCYAAQHGGKPPHKCLVCRFRPVESRCLRYVFWHLGEGELGGGIVGPCGRQALPPFPCAHLAEHVLSQVFGPVRPIVLTGKAVLAPQFRFNADRFPLGPASHGAPFRGCLDGDHHSRGCSV